MGYRFSLSQRLLVALLIVSFSFWAAIAWFTILDSSSDIDQLFDTHIEQTAQALLQAADAKLKVPDLTFVSSVPPTDIPRISSDSASLPHEDDATQPPQSFMFNFGFASLESIRVLQAEHDLSLRFLIWSADGKLLLRSPKAPEILPGSRDGFFENTDQDGLIWRHYGLWNQAHDLRIVVTEAHDMRHRLIQHIALHLVTPLVLGLPVLIFLLWLSIGKGLDSLTLLTREISSRKPDNLQPLDEDSAPKEVRPMVLALNDLLARFTHSLESERRFTADAAHELRTPLAAIKMQLYAARVAVNEAERLRAMAQLQLGVERGIRLVSQLLALARLDPEQSLPDPETVNLTDVACVIYAELAPLAEQYGHVLTLDIQPDIATVTGNTDLLVMLLCNLVDNAIRYTPHGGQIRVNLRSHATGSLMEVVDNGPGISEAQQTQVFDRFFRLAGSAQPGTGLGLAICRRIVELHKATIELANGPGNIGLVVRINLSSVPPEK